MKKQQLTDLPSMMPRYLSPTSLYKEAAMRLTELKKYRDFLQNKSKNDPKGNIRIVNKGNYVQFYDRLDSREKSGKYISKSDHNRIQKLIQKKYSSNALIFIENEIQSIEKFIASSGNVTDGLRALYSNAHNGVQKYMDPIDISDNDFVNMWLSVPYIKKSTDGILNPQVSEKGDIVRSKSELNISNYLYKRGIPYKYERPLALNNGVTVHPDFTVLDVKRRREVIWEHLGMMDDVGYSRNAVRKLRDYEKSGFYLGDNLIITLETSTVQLSTEEIAGVVDHYF